MSRRHPDHPRPQRRPSGPWRHGPIPVVGVVGGIGAGKSEASAAFAARGAFVLDADAIGHALLDQSPARDRILERFGEAILAPHDEDKEGVRRPIDRRALAGIVFAVPSALLDLETILHPLMRKTFEKAIARESRRARHPAVVLDAAILFEAEWDSLCDLIVHVEARPEVRLARLEATRGWTAEGLAAREKAQGDPEEKRRRSHFVLANDGDREAFRASADALWPVMISSPRRRPTQDREASAPSSRGQPSP